MTKIIKAEDIDFGSATEVISGAQKFVIPVPAFEGGGEPLVFPKGHEKEGQQITDWQGKPIGENGLVFFNAKDQAVQAVAGDGNGVVIINQVTEAQAEKLSAKIRQVIQGDALSTITVAEFKEVLAYAITELGLNDIYNSDRNFIASKMTTVGQGSGIEAFGLHKRDDRDVCLAVYLGGKGSFEGPSATPQIYEDGAVIVKQGDAVRLVQPKIFEETYLLRNGSALQADKMGAKPEGPRRASSPTP